MFKFFLVQLPMGRVSLRRAFLIFVASMLNYSTILLLIILWQNVYLAYLMSAVTGFFLGLMAQRFRDFLALMLLSYFFASFTSTLIFISPALLRSDMIWFQVEVGILGAAGSIINNSFVIVPLSFLFGFFGLLFYDSFVKVKLPKIF